MSTLRQRFRAERRLSRELLERAKKPKTKVELWPEEGEKREEFMDRCVTAMTKCVGKEKAPRVCGRKWRKSEKLGKKGMVTRAAIEAEDDPDLLIEPCGKACIACEGAEAPFSQRAFDPSEPRDDAGKWTTGGGGSEAKPSGGGKSKKPAKKEDFDKAGIRIPASDNPVSQKDFLDKWNSKIGVDPEEFKKQFLGGVPASMTIRSEMGTSQFHVSGNIKNDSGDDVGNYERNIRPDQKEAYSAYFKLNKSTTGHDTGKKVLAGNIEMYKQIGIEKVAVTANIDVGGYAWAKYGYVPTQDAWNSLRAGLERKLTGGSSSSGGRTSSGMEADDWDQLSSDVQDNVRDEWMRQTRQEFLSSEEQNWRDSGQALGDAKSILTDNFVSAPTWAVEALDAAREDRKEQGLPPIPYTNDQLFGAISLEYENDGEGRGDPEVKFDDAYLKQPQGYDEAQGTLPGIEPIDPATFLTEPMREEITNNLVESFTKQAEEDADDLDPPSYLSENVGEYQDEYWDQKSDAEKLSHAIEFGMADIEIEEDPEDEDAQAQMALEESHADPVLAAVQSSDPKSIWKVADSPRGKDLLLGTGWSGVLNLKDPESMKRFNDYVGKAKHA